MLVIRRKLGESLLIGDDIEIEILESSVSQVKLGIRAPKHVPVLRKEIRVVSEQNRASSQPPSVEDLKRVLKAISHS